MAGRPAYEEALRDSGVLAHLAPFDPHVIGTLPLGLAVAESDIDIACHAPDAARFAAALWTHFHAEEGFALHQWRRGERPVVARFVVLGWPFEIFGAPARVSAQMGWRHFAVEQRLLALGGAALRDAVMALRARGFKTEPAIAAALGLAGDPYTALDELFGASDAALTKLLRKRIPARRGAAS